MKPSPAARAKRREAVQGRFFGHGSAFQFRHNSV
jgi:hypothetical protein